MWHYDDGLTTDIGSGHSGKVTAVRISPDRSIIVSVGSEGGIFIWGMPPSTETRAPMGDARETHGNQDKAVESTFEPEQEPRVNSATTNKNRT